MTPVFHHTTCSSWNEPVFCGYISDNAGVKRYAAACFTLRTAQKRPGNAPETSRKGLRNDLQAALDRTTCCEYYMHIRLQSIAEQKVTHIRSVFLDHHMCNAKSVDSGFFLFLNLLEVFMYRFAVYGKGGIGKSTVCSALSCAFAEKGMKVLQVGCDPKADSTLYLHEGKRITTMLDTLRRKRESAVLDDLVVTGYRGIVCAEAGGPTPGLGCAGRGIATAFEALDKRDAFDIIKPDLVLYDVLGDVVCGGFAMPIREGYAEKVFIVTSGENMSIYAAANIAMAVETFRQRGYAQLGGLILNRRNVPDELAKVQVLANDLNTQIIADLPRDDHISDAQDSNRSVMEAFPDCDFSKAIRSLADRMTGAGKEV